VKSNTLVRSSVYAGGFYFPKTKDGEGAEFRCDNGKVFNLCRLQERDAPGSYLTVSLPLRLGISIRVANHEAVCSVSHGENFRDAEINHLRTILDNGPTDVEFSSNRRNSQYGGPKNRKWKPEKRWAFRRPNVVWVKSYQDETCSLTVVGLCKDPDSGKWYQRLAGGGFIRRVRPGDSERIHAFTAEAGWKDLPIDDLQYYERKSIRRDPVGV
jgi:hypothetical protein